MAYLRRSVNTNKDRPTCWMGPIGFPNSLRNKTIYGENVETPEPGYARRDGRSAIAAGRSACATSAEILARVGAAWPVEARLKAGCGQYCPPHTLLCHLAAFSRATMSAWPTPRAAS